MKDPIQRRYHLKLRDMPRWSTYPLWQQILWWQTELKRWLQLRSSAWTDPLGLPLSQKSVSSPSNTHTQNEHEQNTIKTKLLKPKFNISHCHCINLEVSARANWDRNLIQKNPIVKKEIETTINPKLEIEDSVQQVWPNLCRCIHQASSGFMWVYSPSYCKV